MPLYKKIVFGPHARERMKERSIAESDVRAVMSNPDVTLPASREDRRKLCKTVNGRWLSVIVKEKNDGTEAVVISAYGRD